MLLNKQMLIKVGYFQFSMLSLFGISEYAADLFYTQKSVYKLLKKICVLDSHCFFICRWVFLSSKM